MNTLILILSYVVLLLIVAVGYLLWNNRKLNRVADSTPQELNALWQRTRNIQEKMDRIPRVNYNDPFVQWSAFETAQDRINRLEHLVDDLTKQSIKDSLEKSAFKWTHTNPEDDHAAE